MRTILVLAACLPVFATAIAGERAPVSDAARPCPGYGPGFVEVPGSSTCVRISGRVSSSYTTATRRVTRDQIAGFGTSARVAADVRTQTDYGPMRAYVRMKAGTGYPPPDRY